MIDERFEVIFEVLPKKPEFWTINEVAEWLKIINMEKYTEQFSIESLTSRRELGGRAHNIRIGERRDPRKRAGDRGFAAQEEDRER